MKVNILYVKDNGKLDSERVILKVLAKTDIGKYVLCDTTYNSTNGSVSNKLRHTFWFPDKVVNEGDYVALYTTSGTNYQHDNQSKTITHCFYWGLDKTVWNKDGDGAVLFEIGEWNAKNVLAKT